MLLLQYFNILYLLLLGRGLEKPKLLHMQQVASLGSSFYYLIYLLWCFFPNILLSKACPLPAKPVSILPVLSSN